MLKQGRKGGGDLGAEKRGQVTSFRGGTENGRPVQHAFTTLLLILREGLLS